jgi:hypothetical protein
MVATLRRSSALAAFSFFSFVVTGCYESEFPLDQTPQADIDSRVPGTWHCTTPNADDRDVTLTVSPGRDRVYAVSLQEFGQSADRYEAHASSVGGVTLLNLRNLEGSDKPWSFVRYELLEPRILHVEVLDEHAVAGASSPNALREALTGRVNDSGLYDDLLTCVRMEGN